MTINGDLVAEPRTSRVRFMVYWLSAVASTLLLLFFLASMLTVPDILPSLKVWMLAIAGIGIAISLGVGTWRFGSTEAPATLWPLGPVMGVVLLAELAYCAINVFMLAPHH